MGFFVVVVAAVAGVFLFLLLLGGPSLVRHDDATMLRRTKGQWEVIAWNERWSLEQDET